MARKPKNPASAPAGPAGPTERGKAWSGRFEKATAASLEAFSSSVHFDRQLWRQDIRGSLAHAEMLAGQGILSPSELESLRSGLQAIHAEFEAGRFVLDPGDEDIHMNIERRLFEIAGDVAGKLHSGRSRNDQVATDFLLWMRDAIPALRRALLDLRSVLVERAGRELDVILPGYTHLQRAQPVRLAHHWLAYECLFARDDGRLADARARMNTSPLGAGALAGSTLALDREKTATALGFERPAANSLDAVSSRDAALELLSALSILAIHLSRISEELVLWNSTEFGFIEFDDAFATGSSLMPQKKNPDVPELIRGKSGRVVGSLVSLLVTLKGLPLSYNRDMQEDKEPVFDAVETVGACLGILAPTVQSMRVKAEAMAQAAADPLLIATDLAEYLVGRGVAFRDAHGIVGRVVAHARAQGRTLDTLTQSELLEFHPDLEIEPSTFFSAERSLEARTLVGGPARKNVESEVERALAVHARLATQLGEGE
jgi:argininosuccinate lyase